MSERQPERQPELQPEWQPGAELKALRMRADLYARIREFFATRKVMEVDVPLMGATAASDPHIDSIKVEYTGHSAYFLQSSPEYFMKRLLAAGSGAIYSLGKAFRNGEAGGRHNPEFTMLEWYRPGFDEHMLMDEVECLLKSVLPPLSVKPVRRESYRELFERSLDVDPHIASLDTLRQIARQHIELSWDDEDRDVWLDLLMTHCIEPSLGPGLVFIYDYPASQAALAKVLADKQGMPVARRFEAYLDGLEVTNGYWELTDAEEQARRFQRDIALRRKLDLPGVQTDKKLLSALHSGMPECAGVALGVDRLLMRMGAGETIGDVLAFSFDRL